MERKIYRVCAFCGQRAEGYGAMQLPCPAMQPGAGNWFTELKRPATREEYEIRAQDLGVVPVPSQAHRGY